MKVETAFMPKEVMEPKKRPVTMDGLCTDQCPYMVEIDSDKLVVYCDRVKRWVSSEEPHDYCIE